MLISFYDPSNLIGCGGDILKNPANQNPARVNARRRVEVRGDARKVVGMSAERSSARRRAEACGRW